MPQWIEEIAADISIDSLPESYQQVALIVGVEAALKLSEYLGGAALYFPKLEEMLREKRDERIRQEFNGINHRELARKYNLSERWLREIVQVKRPVVQQADLFDEE